MSIYIIILNTSLYVELSYIKICFKNVEKHETKWFRIVIMPKYSHEKKHNGKYTTIYLVFSFFHLTLLAPGTPHVRFPTASSRQTWNAHWGFPEAQEVFPRRLFDDHINLQSSCKHFVSFWGFIKGTGVYQEN